MKKPLIVMMFNCFFIVLAFGQEKAFQIYNGNGKKATYKTLNASAVKADIILFGELHNDPISHWLELELTKSLFEEHGNNLILGAEMLESDNQIQLNEYLMGFIREKDFERESKVWPNHQTDYRPLLRFAKEKNLNFIATNIPRRFANIVYRFGLDTLEYLPESSKQFFAPLPILYDTSLRCYKEISIMAEGHGGENLPKSQAIKDATMAYFIVKNMEKDTKFLHYNGAYHSKFHESIMWYLLQLDDDLDILTIEVVEQSDISRFNNDLAGESDYFIVVDEDMCKTH